MHDPNKLATLHASINNHLSGALESGNSVEIRNNIKFAINKVNNLANMYQEQLSLISLDYQKDIQQLLDEYQLLKNLATRKAQL